MKRKMLKNIAFLSALLLLGSGAASNIASAADVEEDKKIYKEEIGKRYHVGNFFELSVAINKVQDGDEIILDDDIALDNKVVIKSSICLNLNGHTISVNNDKAGIVIGDKKFDHIEKYKIRHAGKYKWEPTEKKVFIPSRNEVNSDGKVIYKPSKTVKIVKNKLVWHPDRDEVGTREVYNYRDDITVIIKDGKILRTKGKDGKDGVENSENDYNGEDGITPNAPVEVLSGTLRLSNMKLKGGDGGNGGNGGYQSLVHFIFGGGDAGNGGDGAKGGYALYVHRKGKCSVVVDRCTDLKAGKPGKGGKAGEVNPGYWLYSGYEGKDGKKGEQAQAFN